MKTNRLEITLPEATAHRLSSKLENLASNLARFAMEFGVVINEHLGPRLATIGFTNGVLIGLHHAEAAAALEELLTAEAIPSTDELHGLAAAYEKVAILDSDWTDVTNRFLRRRWNSSSDNSPNLEPRLEVLLRVLHGVRAGLVVAREASWIAQLVEELTKTLWVENHFLSGCLLRWSNNDWEPYSAPYVEFTTDYYVTDTIERRLLSLATAELYPIALALHNPWSLAFWSETGWNGGRNLARNYPAECRALLTEATKEYLNVWQETYQRCVLGTVRSDGEVQIEKATLRFFGDLKEADMARSYCKGREPRRLVRAAFRFAYWMGVFSSYLLPSTAN